MGDDFMGERKLTTHFLWQPTWRYARIKWDISHAGFRLSKAAAIELCHAWARYAERAGSESARLDPFSGPIPEWKCLPRGHFMRRAKFLHSGPCGHMNVLSGDRFWFMDLLVAFPTNRKNHRTVAKKKR